SSVVGRRLVRRSEPAAVPVSTLPHRLELAYLGTVPLAPVPSQTPADSYTPGPGRRPEHPWRLALRHLGLRVRHRRSAVRGADYAYQFQGGLARHLSQGIPCFPPAPPDYLVRPVVRLPRQVRSPAAARAARLRDAGEPPHPALRREVD